MNENYYLAFKLPFYVVVTAWVYQGTAIRDRIQESLRGQSSDGPGLLQNGKDDENEEYYDDEEDTDEEYFEEYFDHDDDLSPQNNEKDSDKQQEYFNGVDYCQNVSSNFP